MLGHGRGLTIWQGGESMMQCMTRAIAIAQAQMQEWHVELLRSAIVTSCAIALIAAGRVLPF